MNDNNSAFERHKGNQRKQWKNKRRDTFGDNLKKKKKKNRIRIVFQNINGLMIEDESVDKRE